jgi:site-specific DNA recombinase
MIRAILYSRVSTDDQADNYSLPSQEAGTRQYAEQHSMTVVGALQDVASGATLERPGLTKIRELVHAKAIDTVIVYASDRLTRSVAHAMLLRDEFKTANVTLHTVARGASQDSPEGGLMETIEAAFAEFERLKIKERMTRGTRSKLKSGKAVGQNLPFGYRYADDCREVVVEFPDEAAIVRSIYDWYLLDNMSAQRIAERLTLQQVPTPSDCTPYAFNPKTKRGYGEWSLSTVLTILGNPAYRGDLSIIRAGETFTLAIPPIIDPPIWFSVERLRADRKKYANRNAKRLYLLRGHVRCACCGAAVSGTSSGSNQGRAYYECQHTGHYRKHAASKCALPLFRAEALEGAVWLWVVSEVLNEDRIRAAIGNRQDATEGERARLEGERGALQRQLTDVEARIGKLVELYTAGVFTLDEVAAQKAHLDQARQSCTNEIAALDLRIAGLATVRDRAEELCALVREIQTKVHAGLTDETKFRVLLLLDIKVTLSYQGETGKGKKPQKFADVMAYLTLDHTRLTLEHCIVPKAASGRGAHSGARPGAGRGQGLGGRRRSARGRE